MSPFASAFTCLSLGPAEALRTSGGAAGAGRPAADAGPALAAAPPGAAAAFMLFISFVSGARWPPIWAPPGRAAPGAGAPPFFHVDAGAGGAAGGFAFAPAIADFAMLLNCFIAPDIGGAAGTPAAAAGACGNGLLGGPGALGNGLFGGPGALGNGLFGGPGAFGNGLFGGPGIFGNGLFGGRFGI